MYIVLFKTDFAAKPSLLNANKGNMHREFCIVRTKYKVQLCPRNPGFPYFFKLREKNIIYIWSIY